MSSMEPDIQEFLKRIAWSVTLLLVHLLILSTIGIAGGWFFFDDVPSRGNYIFYGWILISSTGVFLLLLKWWKKKFPHG